MGHLLAKNMTILLLTRFKSVLLLFLLKIHNNFSASYTIHEVFSMKHLKRYTIIGIFFVLTIGTLAHFLYDWAKNNHIVGLFTPINESI